MTARTCALGKATMILNFPQRVYKTLLCAARSPFPLFRKATSVLTTLSDSHSALSDSLQPKGCSLPSSSVPGILRLEWAAISSSWGSSQPRGQTWVSWWIFYHLSHLVLRRDRGNRPHLESLVLSPCHHQTKTWYLNLITGLIIALPNRAGASQVAQQKRIHLLMQEMRVQSLGQEAPPGEGNGHPLPYSCLGNLMDRGAWQASPHGVAKESDAT